MTIYETRQYLAYKWKAKGRHGTHSPFVYAFVEDVLMHTIDQAALMEHITRYFQFRQVIKPSLAADLNDLPRHTFLSDTGADFLHNSEDNSLQKTSLLPFNRLFIVASKQVADPEFTNKLFDEIQHNDVIIIMPLYKSETDTRQWQHVKANDNVKMTMDLFNMGLLFFRQEFKIKQDFVLKP